MAKTRRLAEDNKFSRNIITGKLTRLSFSDSRQKAKLKTKKSAARFCEYCQTHEQSITGHDSKIHYYCNC